MRAVFLICIAIAPCSVLGLWPIPRNLQTGTTLVKLASTFNIKVDIDNPPQDLLDAVSQANTYIQTDKLQRLVVGRGANDSAALGQAPTLPGLTLSLLTSDAPESANCYRSCTAYWDPQRRILSHSPKRWNVCHSDCKFHSRVVQRLDDLRIALAPISIVNDIPAFPYRGFMLDTARNFFPVADIKRTLDAMSWVKINMFHWHVVDSQSFPLDIPAFPEIASKGAYSSSEIYSAADVQDIVSYAGARGIDVLVEIDTPGHTAVIASSHPEHIACSQASPWTDFANEPPAGQLRLASAATTNFTAQLISSIAKTLPSSLFSTGGDELNTNCYAEDAQTQADLAKSGRTLEQALNVFTQATHKSLTDLGKTPVVWEEMVLEHTVTLPKDTVVMVWISSQHASSVAAKNFRIVHAPSDYFYLDCGAGEWLGNNPSGNSWCDPFKTWQKSYTFDPLASLTTAQRSLVLGGQQLLWTEQSSPENVDSIVWPRAASSAEVISLIFWTGATLPDGTARNVASALPRLHDLRYRMVRRGVRAIALQPHFCVLRPGVCDLRS
ncbi:hypothetical protein D9615_010509 [Tricholomella constricta]|uniref:beta-N-acetylhexosaminidase n=1 Tax=Tricholomella constricta TaxID=117010 RepID=A0A8H5GME0_9AGAR|nr:hypothetical protein D9615_010509 [Tricholomella constricta]